MRSVLISLAIVVGCAFAGLVVGFGGGWIYGPLFGTHAGHGLGDLIYLFVGALFGVISGAILGIALAVRRLGDRDHPRAPT